MAIIGNVMAYKAYLSQAKSMQALDKQDYAAAIECENKALEGYEKAMAKGMNQGKLPDSLHRAASAHGQI